MAVLFCAAITPFDMDRSNRKCTTVVVGTVLSCPLRHSVNIMLCRINVLLPSIVSLTHVFGHEVDDIANFVQCNAGSQVSIQFDGRKESQLIALNIQKKLSNIKKFSSVANLTFVKEANFNVIVISSLHIENLNNVLNVMVNRKPRSYLLFSAKTLDWKEITIILSDLSQNSLFFVYESRVWRQILTIKHQRHFAVNELKFLGKQLF